MSELQHIIALTKLHISQEYDPKSWIATDTETYEYYKDFASKGKRAPVSKPQIAQTQTTPRPVAVKPKPAPQKKQPSEPKSKSIPIERETLPSAPKTEFADLKKIISEHFPNQKILDFVPDDTRAKEIAAKWKKQAIAPEVIILHSTATSQERLFLENVARAIEIRFCPAVVMTPEEFSPNEKVKLVIGSKTEHAGATLEIGPVDSYLKNPQQKAKLWQDLKNTLQSS